LVVASTITAHGVLKKLIADIRIIRTDIIIGIWILEFGISFLLWVFEKVFLHPETVRFRMEKKLASRENGNLETTGGASI
jgi:hypothetical protein